MMSKEYEKPLIFVVNGVISLWDVLTAVLLLSVGTGFYRLMRPNLGSMRIPVIAYIVIISVMVNRAASAPLSPEFTPSQALLVLFGALLFYLSDVILAANKFWKPWRYNRISLVFYYSGQLLIALSTGYFC
ncbi:MAG: lysoplasmalogenase [candidate division KSB1 bacterium]|nr:lysoplasmalogenase [candidate division KSB1 bacterium]